MKSIFAKYPRYKTPKNLPDNYLVFLKKQLDNPFMEEIMGFDGNIEPGVAYGHLFSTRYYYFFSSGRLAERISLWDLEAVYPNHSKNEMTAILKDGTVKELLVGDSRLDELEVIFEEICNIYHETEYTTNHLEFTDEEQHRIRLFKQLSQILHYDIPRPYKDKGRQTLIELARKLEAAGDSEELPFIYDQIGFTSTPPENSYYYAKCYLHMPLCNFSLSKVYYYLHCMKRNVRFCDDKVRRYDNPEYREFIEMCRTTPLPEVREKLENELNLYASWLRDANILNL